MPESTFIAVPATFPAKAEAAAGVEPSVPWSIRCTVAAVTSALAGGYWDISWQMAIYLCGVLAGISSASSIFSMTLRSDEARHEAGVEMWGFRGPLDAFKRACLMPACNKSNSRILPQHRGGPSTSRA